MLAAFCSCCCSQPINDRLIRVVRTESFYQLAEDITAVYRHRCLDDGVEFTQTITYDSEPVDSSIFGYSCSSWFIECIDTFGSELVFVGTSTTVHYINSSEYDSFISLYPTSLPPLELCELFVYYSVNTFEIQEI